MAFLTLPVCVNSRRKYLPGMNIARVETVRINFIMNILQEKLFDLEEVLETISFCFFLSGLALVKCSGKGRTNT